MVRQDPKVYGDLKDIPVGSIFKTRVDVYNARLHGHPVFGIFGTKSDGGAFSIVLNEGYEDDEDNGETIIYTGEGKGEPEEGESKTGNKQQGDQDMDSRGNAALKENVETKYPVRVIRGSKGNIEYSPQEGYRYDGLYDVERAYIEEGKAGFKMCKFLLKRWEAPRQALYPSISRAETIRQILGAPTAGRRRENLNEPAPETSMLRRGPLPR
ncbi:PUA-like domain-containing protein [Mycena haematopus]|nr:PUA-like domain-containing protein [Mycena haematopus]